ncbi:MFS transporter [Sphingomonas sp. BIUV-7]|uniref:MFS transporter n=1 Tax=Sphingomonas natans TaxID=3063330 RepID=A0ABT8Y3E9_9SPHN|nr:MFS transporter [Sphingomonas sp. BIUV-7]MDO6412834.1 MFS transporter [Sphingomonas sp. BIUV-7]
MISDLRAGIAEKSGRLRWTVVTWAFVISAVSYLDRNNISIAGSSIKEAFALSDRQLGLVFSAFALGYALSQPFAGRIADRFGAYRCVAAAIVWWGVFTALTAMLPPGLPFALTLLIVVRLLLGVGEAVIFPATNRLVSSWVPKSERGLANGFIFAGVGIGGGIAPPLITAIVVNFGWQWAFYASAIIGVVVGIGWLFAVRDTPHEHPAISPQELAYIEAHVAPRSKGEGGADWRTVVKDKQVLLLTTSYFCFGYVAYIFFSWFFIYLSKVRGLDLKSSALLATLPFLAMTIFSTLGGSVSDRMAARHGDRIGRCRIAAGAMILASLFVMGATAVSSAQLASIVLAGGAGSLYFAQSAYWTLSANIGGKSSGVLSGVMNMGAQLGGVVTASTMPIVAESFGWTASFLVAGGIAMVGGLLWLLIDPQHELSEAEAG